MSRIAAYRAFICLAVLAAVLCLPLGSLAVAAGPAGGCSCGHGVAPGIVSGQGCCPGTPGHCGACGHGGLVTCRCASGDLAFIVLPASGAPAWQVSPYVPTMITVPAALFPPNIFHPPEFTRFSL